MTLKEMFKKVETYNEIAELMGNKPVRVYFYDFPHGEHFNTYKELSKQIRADYTKEAANAILEHNGFLIGESVTIKYIGIWDDELTLEIEVDLSEN